MHKYKARDIILNWPHPKSTSKPSSLEPIVPPLFPLGGDEYYFLNRKHQRGFDHLYHLRQQEMMDRFVANPRRMETLRLTCQLVSRRGYIQIFATDQLTNEMQPLVALDCGYPAGVVMIDMDLCGIGAATPMSCMFCQYGHLNECHFPRNCQQAQCSHLTRYVAANMPAATETLQ